MMKKKCPHCGYVNFAHETRCRRCKKELPDICPSCGNPIAVGASFCSHCGEIFDAEKVDTGAYKTASLSRREVRSRKELKPHQRGQKLCPECHELVSTEALFCTHCGAVFASPEEVQRRIRVISEEAAVVEREEKPLELDDVLEVLALVEPGPEEPFPRLDAPLRDLMGRLSALVLVTTDWRQRHRDFVASLRGLVPQIKPVVVRRGPPAMDPAGDLDEPELARVVEASRLEEEVLVL